MPSPTKPFGFAQIENVLVERRIEHGRRGVIVVLEQHRRAEDAKARIDADVEVGRPDIGFDRAELQPVDHARDRSELAARIDADLDPPAGGLLDGLLVELDVLVLRFVERGGPEFHHEIGRRRGDGVKLHTAASAKAIPVARRYKVLSVIPVTCRPPCAWSARCA